MTSFAGDKPDGMTQEMYLDPQAHEGVEVWRQGRVAVQPREWNAVHGCLFDAADLHDFYNSAVFLQWQRQGDVVSGKRSVSYFDKSSTTQSNADVSTFTGTVTGLLVSITFVSGDTWNGAISGSKLTLSYVDPSDGSLRTVEFHAASASDYNAAVA